MTLPETLDRQQVVRAIADRIVNDPGLIVSAHLGPDEFPTAVVRIGDFPDNAAVADAIGLDDSEPPHLSRVDLDGDGATVETIDGETHHIPFDDAIEETPCPA